MRDIKFRAWDPDNKQMVYIDPLKLNRWDGQFDSGWYEDSDGTPHALWTEIKEGRLMQYTGLKDKSGVEIYEGDIVGRIDPTAMRNNGQVDRRFKSRWEYIWPVEFGEFNGNWGGWEAEGDPYLGYNLLPIEQTSIEVIGNIYENPELLK